MHPHAALCCAVLCCAAQEEVYAECERAVRAELSERFRSFRDTGASLDAKVGSASGSLALFPRPLDSSPVLLVLCISSLTLLVPPCPLVLSRSGSFRSCMLLAKSRRG